MDYFPYPPEFRIVYDVLHKDTKHTHTHVMNSIGSFGEKRQELFFDIIKQKELEKGVTDVSRTIQQGLKSIKAGDDISIVHFMDAYINRVDVYSMGVMFASIKPYIDCAKSTKATEKQFNEFIYSMTHPNMVLRATPEKAYELYKSLAKS